jgi:hypothetical protein
MATVDLSKPQGGGHPSRQGPTNVPYTVEAIVDYAEVLAAKGSALAAADIVKAIAVPANTVILSAGLQQLAQADSTALTVHVGTAADDDQFAVSFNAKTGAVGTYSVVPAAGVPRVAGAATSVDVVFATLTGDLTAGAVRVYAVLLDVAPKKAPGIAVSTASA